MKKKANNPTGETSGKIWGEVYGDSAQDPICGGTPAVMERGTDLRNPLSGKKEKKKKWARAQGEEIASRK